jgi:hypothetical protein
MINLANQNEDSSYCYIIYLNAEKKEACVRVGECHQLRDRDCVNIESCDEKRGVLLYQGIINRVDSNTVQIKKLCLVEAKQRRSDIRINITVPHVLKVISKGLEFVRPKKGMFLETVNVSAGGMLIRSLKDLGDCGTCLEYDFPLEQNVLSCRAQIVRKQSDGEYFMYGCKLLNDENDRAELRKFVFQTQVKTKKALFHDDK